MRGAKTKPVFSALFIPSARLISPDPSLLTITYSRRQYLRMPTGCHFQEMKGYF